MIILHPLMRIPVFLFSFYLLALSVLPCSDTLRSFVQETQPNISVANDHHAEASDICSPFCICSCCGSPVISKFRAFTAVIAKPAQFAGRNYPLRSIGFVTTHTASIWHPPQPAA